MNHLPLANWNGKEMPLLDVKVSVLDRAFLFGDAVYEVIRVYEKRLFRLDDHLDRLFCSLSSMQISGVEINEVRKRIVTTLEHSGLKDGLAYIQITRGEGVRHHWYPENMQPNVLIFLDSFHDPYEDQRQHGTYAVTYTDIRWARNDIKCTSLAANCMAAQYAHSRGCRDVIFVDGDGLVTEGSHTSVFAVKDGNVIIAPASAKVLPGITKRQVIELARLGDIPLREGRIKATAISELDEIFLAGTPEEILPVVQVDSHTIGNGKPGPVVRKLQAQFKSALNNWLHSPADSES